MKKTVAVLAVVLSTGAFARGHMNSSSNTGMQHNNGQMMQNHLETLTEEQQIEFNELHGKHMRENQKIMLDVEEINLKTQREMLGEKPNQSNLNKLIDERSKIMAQKEKKNLEFRLQMKEKFGIEMTGRMGHTGRNKGRGMHS